MKCLARQTLVWAAFALAASPAWAAGNFLNSEPSVTPSNTDVMPVIHGASAAGDGTGTIGTASVASEISVNAPVASASTRGLAQCDGATITCSGGVMVSAAAGGSFGTAPISTSGAASLLGALRFGIRTIASGSSDTVLSTDYVVGWNKSTSSASIENLPGCNSSSIGRSLVVSDLKGDTNSGAYAITIAPNGSNTIGGASTWQITAAFGSITLTCDGVSNWTAIPSVEYQTPITVGVAGSSSGVPTGTLIRGRSGAQAVTMGISYATPASLNYLIGTGDAVFLGSGITGNGSGCTDFTTWATAITGGVGFQACASGAATIEGTSITLGPLGGNQLQVIGGATSSSATTVQTTGTGALNFANVNAVNANVGLDLGYQATPDVSNLTIVSLPYGATAGAGMRFLPRASGGALASAVQSGDAALVAGYTAAQPLTVAVFGGSNSIRLDASNGVSIAGSSVGITGPRADQAVQTVSSGSSVTVAAGKDRVILLSGAGTTFTLTTPSAPADGQVMALECDQSTTLTVTANSGQSMKGAVTACSTTQGHLWHYRLGDTTWRVDY
jgi:hypothetical protein